MATTKANAKQNGSDTKKNGTTPKTTTTGTQKPAQAAKKNDAAKDVTEKLAQEAIGNTIPINIEERMTAFDQLTGFANQRTRLKTKLDELNKFVFNNGTNCEFTVKDEDGKTFKTTNNNLITLVTGILKDTLEKRKTEIEEQIVTFQL